MAAALFAPIALRGLTLANRIVVSSMCQYDAEDGSANDWHLMHLGQFATGAAGLVMTEATHVSAVGRITHRCLGLWSDANEQALARVVGFCRHYGARRSASSSPMPGARPRSGRRSRAASRSGRASGPGPRSAPPRCLMPRAGTRPWRWAAGLEEVNENSSPRRSAPAARLRPARAARRPWLSAAPVPVADQQPAHRRLWRHSSGGCASRSRCSRRSARSGPRTSPGRARLGDRLGRGRLDADGNRRLREGAEGLGLRLRRRLERRPRSRQQIPLGPGYQVPFAERVRREAGSRPGRSA